ncbi:MAG: aldolase/citrate lyase family protein [Dehalococcoidia bacterium]|nr:aldolase/citrate lyase family protein [Dehalococcoidia bacterium]MDP7613044.1 aldolase/citrate lyase family protein [Dehalococcoidia bacterium]
MTINRNKGISGHSTSGIEGPGRHLKKRLSQGEVLIGPLLEEYAKPSLIKLFQHAGFDFVFIEYEHGYFSLSDLSTTILSARDNGLPVIAKTPQIERMEVAKLLEAGVSGIQLPRTETVEQIETLISYMKFPPLGTRAIAPGYGNSDYRMVDDWQSWMDEQDKETTVVLHFETIKAYDNAEELVSVPGVDMVYCGPGDTSVEFGRPGDFNHPDVIKPMENILELCKKYKVPFGTTPLDAISAGKWAQKGATFFEAESEVGFIRSASNALIKDYRNNISKFV